MGDLVPLYTTTEGRIARRSWWLGIVLIVIANILIGIGLGLAGVGSAWAQLLTFVLFFGPTWCIGIKRRHDRDSDGTDFKIFMALSAIMAVLQALRIGGATTQVDGVAVFMPSLPLSLIFLAVAMYGIYILIQLGFLPGTTGSNRYGPHPVAGTAGLDDA